MKNFSLLIACCLVALTFSACKKDVVSSVSLPDGYYENQWNDAMKLAQDSNRKIFVMFYAEDCDLCATMKTTLSDPDIQVTLKNTFVRVMMDAEKGQGEELYIAYNLENHPNSLVTTSNGTVLGKFEGSKDKASFLKFIAPFE